VIGGSIATEFLVQKQPEAPTMTPLDELETSAPIDELDDRESGGVDDGPVYRDEAAAPNKEPAP
jgi:hypothetical protein